MDIDVGTVLVQVAVVVGVSVVAGVLVGVGNRRRRDRSGWVSAAARQLSGPPVPGLPPGDGDWRACRLRTSPGAVELGAPSGSRPTTPLDGAVARATGEQTPRRVFADVDGGREVLVLEVAGAVLELAVEPRDVPAVLGHLAPAED